MTAATVPAHHENFSASLQQLQWLRAFVGIAQTTALLSAHRYLQTDAVRMLAVLLLLQALLITATHWRLQQARRRHRTGISAQEWLLQLLLDCGLLVAILYFAGGATNPFVSYLLVPVALSAATLPWRYTAALAMCCLCAYNALLLYYQPLQILAPHHQHEGSGPGLHVIGMWLNFGLSAALIGYFVSAMAGTLRRQREHINQLREQQLVDENIITVATLAAGTAHELGTPLSSIAVLLADLLAEHTRDTALASDLALMSEQVARCQQSLRRLADTAREHQQQLPLARPLGDFLQQLVSQWRVLRPDAPARFTLPETGTSLTRPYALPLNISQAIINLLDNAADACNHTLDIRIQADNALLTIVIEDDGPGIRAGQLAAVYTGQPLQASDKQHGMGLGLLLSHATMERAGGTIALQPREPHGTRTTIHLPLTPFAATAEDDR